MSHGQIETAYIGIEATDPAAVGRYLTEVVGLMPGEPTSEGAATWRVDGKAQRLWVQPGAKDDALCVGFELRDAGLLEQACSRLGQAGFPGQPGTAAQKAARRVRELVRFRAPWGVDVELVLGLQDAATPFASAAFPQGLVTQGQGFGHFVFATGNQAEYDAARRFAIDGLGMKLSDWLRMPIPPGEMHVSFLHCNPRHHSMAIACIPMPEVPRRLHHVNFEVTQVAAVGTAYERAVAMGTPIANTIGQHENDGMVSFYSFSPGGWQVEIGATGRTVGEDWSDVREYHRISVWGHQPPAVLGEMLAKVAVPAPH